MFLPFSCATCDWSNRVVVSPMAQYCAVDGVPDDWHLVHYGARATGGAGLVYTEMTCVSPEGRITPGCTGTVERGPARRLAAHRRRSYMQQSPAQHLPAARALRAQGLDAARLAAG